MKQTPKRKSVKPNSRLTLEKYMGRIRKSQEKLDMLDLELMYFQNN